MNLRFAAAAIVAVGLVFLGAALLQPSADPEPPSTRDEFQIRVATSAGATRAATVVCEGDISGTGYLAEKPVAFQACTFDHTVSVHRYLLDGRSACALLVADAAPVPDATKTGTATVRGVYFDKQISRHIDGPGGDACDRAAWKLLAPLLPQN